MARIVICFVEPDGQSPLSPLPEKVVAELGLPGTLSNHYMQPYELKSEPATGDPAPSARFASPPFPMPDERISGRVKVALHGQDVSFPLVLTSLR